MEKLKYKECEDCADWKGYISHCMEICGKPLDALEEFNQYKSIGTVEECREAREKQIPKKIIGGKAHCQNRYCPSCNEWMAFDKKRYPYCPMCGQALDWSD